MDRRALLTSVCAVAGAGLVTGCGERDRTGGTDGPIATQLGEPVKGNSPMVVAENFFGDQVKRLTEGRITVEVKPGGVLGDDNRVTEMVRTGQLAFCKTLLANLTAYDKRLGVVNLPYVFHGEGGCLQAIRGELGRRCASILDEHGLTVLAFFYGGDRNVYNRLRQVYTPADLKGMRIRVPQNIVSIDMVNALGAEAVPLATNDIASALEQKLVDAAENSAVFYATEQHTQYARHFSWTRHQQTVDTLLASKTWLSTLPAADRDAIVQAGVLTRDEQLKLWTAATFEQVRAAEAQGAWTNEVDSTAFRKTLAPMLREHRGTFGDLASLLPDLG
ncbi:TRAP transporter substrate-binding protein DctP [Actinoplanes couchii]|uniref:C4-dicarboxylate ABC transporter n=1 Tax=Actinoplanes couchii TaxID=403638 RepID=A0ABQ3WZR1_9ACTN|nr:TRAP transporter substrate-binding protein DctP [Actinoplanes couchii]MDR6316157.1 TRAP-type C4-dicarboxylate transport system substrate-binding protein [Actinoplanes couchii]GID51772.1 C4-dicarboxylate ABC transporter [Actinoplanes couchii]